MQDPIRKIFLAFIQIHILHHAEKSPIYGSWMIDELKQHGYSISSGTLYPILHNMEKTKLLTSQKKTINGKIRKYYSITQEGKNTLKQAKNKINELQAEI